MVHNSETKTDRRVLYTKMFLRESLLALMQEKPIDKITPTELCRHADINRNTFYAHYYTVRDVLREIEEELSAQIMESFETKMTANTTLEVLIEICHILYEKKDLCKILISQNGDAEFLQEFVSLGRGFIVKTWEERGVHLSEEKMNMVFSFIVNGSISIIRAWAAADMRESPAAVAELINRITMYGIMGMKDAAE